MTIIFQGASDFFFFLVTSDFLTRERMQELIQIDSNLKGTSLKFWFAKDVR